MPRAAEHWVGAEEIARRLNDSIIVDVAEAIAMSLKLASPSCRGEREGEKTVGNAWEAEIVVAVWIA